LSVRRSATGGAATARTGDGTQPGPRDLDDMLGTAAGLWEHLRAQLVSEFGPLAEKWSFAKVTSRWSLQLKRKQRAVVYLIPCRGHFLAAFALGEKACAAAREGGLPASVLAVIERAPRYPEGRGVRLEVRSGKDVEHVAVLAAIKMAH
jgi:hypothetical protein